jgi:phosphoesterase RecJ-like protein
VPQWDTATAAVDAAASILLVTHVSPDGDAIGSLLGLAHALRARGKAHLCLVVDGGVPDYLAFIPGSDAVLSAISAASGEFDLMISLDSSDEARTGKAGEYGRAHSRQVINLDHHITNDGFGSIHLVMPGAVSAAEVVMHWLDAMPQPITHDSAIALLTGLVTDTLGFRVSSVTAETLHLAQRLMHAGASLNDIMARTVGSRKYAAMQLWSRVLPSMQLEDGIISATVTEADIAAVGLSEMTDGGLAEFLVTANEARISVVFKQLTEDKTEISFRSKPGFDVGSVAFAIGGGGHRQASGATIIGDLVTARERVMPLLRAAVEQGQPPS